MSKITALQNEIIEERLRLQEIGETTISDKLKDLQKQYIQKLQNTKKLRSFNKSCDADFKKIYKDWANTFSKSTTFEEFWAKYVNKELFDTSKYVGKINNLCKLNLDSIKYSRKAQKQLLTSTILNNNMELVQAVEREGKDLLKAITGQAFMEQWTDKEYRDTLMNTGKIKPLQVRGRFIRSETRLKTIARTEPMRAYNTTSYIVNKERGAKKWYAIGFEDEYTCAECIELYGTDDDPVMYDIEDTRHIPPLHPNCRHTIVYSWEKQEEAIPEPQKTTTKTEAPKSRIKLQHYGEETLNNGVYDLYSPNGETQIWIAKGSRITPQELEAHLNNLPKVMTDNLDVVENFYIHNHSHPNNGGDFNTSTNEINVYKCREGKVHEYNVINHELGHLADYRLGEDEKPYYSDPERYDKIFKEDNELKAWIKPNGRKKVPKRVVSSYAASSYKRYDREHKARKKQMEKVSPEFKKILEKRVNEKYIEDFAESTMAYLNPYMYESFCREYPSRAKLLREIYGEPIFDKNSEFYKLSFENEEYAQRHASWTIKEFD